MRTCQRTDRLTLLHCIYKNENFPFLNLFGAHCALYALWSGPHRWLGIHKHKDMYTHTHTHTKSVTEKFEYQSTTVNQSINQMHHTMMPNNEVDRDVEMGSGREVSNEIFHYFPLCQMPLKMLLPVIVVVRIRVIVVVAAVGFTCDTFNLIEGFPCSWGCFLI